MDEFDRDVRARLLWRYVGGALAVIVVGLLIGLVVGRPFATPGPSSVGAARTTGPTASSAMPTPTAAATPTATATPAALPTQVAPPATFSPDDAWRTLTHETFDSATTWPATEQQGWATGYEDGRYWLKLNGQRTLSYSVPLDAPEFRVAVDVQVTSGYAGLVFLAGEPNIVYRFLIDDAGRYRLERQQGADTTTIYDWTASAELRAGAEARNRIKVQRVENEIQLFANDAKLATYTLPSDETLRGRAGMTLDALARDAVAMAYFDDLVIEVPTVSGD